MSYILDALTKAEHQRDLGQVPGIGSATGNRVLRAVSRRWVYLILLVLLINAGVLVYVFLWPGPDSRPPAPVLSSTPPAVAAPRLSRLASVPALPRQVPKPRLASPPVPQRLTPPATVKVPVHEPLSRTPDVVTDTPGVAAVMGIPLPAAGSRKDSLPVWPQVPGSLFLAINSDLRLDVHVYSEVPQERFVLINMRKYREGDQLQEGPVVDEITPGGVVLSFRGQRFQVPAQ